MFQDDSKIPQQLTRKTVYNEVTLGQNNSLKLFKCFIQSNMRGNKHVVVWFMLVN